MSTTTATPTEAEARTMIQCPCCHKPKASGLVVCWTCFKHETPHGFAPLKNSGLPFADWLEQATNPAEVAAQRKALDRPHAARGIRA